MRRSPTVGDPVDGTHEATARVGRRSWKAGAFTADADVVVREEPLEIQIGSLPVAVVMRTPGDDLELATGFLVTEQVIDDVTQLASVRHCDAVPHPHAEDNVVRATLRAGVAFDPERLRRNLYATSSCGICGKATIEAALAHAPPLRPDERGRVPVARLAELPERLRAGQRVFESTGGLHAAGLFSSAGELRAVREDVGRHNAVDKVIGWSLRTRGALPTGEVLVVSGRVSYEIVQKALAARIGTVAAVSAPTSLAVALARAAGMTLAAFVRPPSLSVYAPDPERGGRPDPR